MDNKLFLVQTGVHSCEQLYQCRPSEVNSYFSCFNAKIFLFSETLNFRISLAGKHIH